MEKALRILLRYLPVLGVMLILAGNGISVYKGGFILATKIMVLIGLALFLTVFVRAESRNIKYYINLGLYTLFILGILVVLYLMVSNHNQIIDVTKGKIFSLSPQTVKFLSSLDKDVKLVAFTEQAEQYKDFLKRYNYLNKKVTLEIYNPFKDHLIARQYDTQVRPGDIFVTHGKRTKKVSRLEEQDITNAIVEVTRESQLVAYFLTGHGEKPLESRVVSPQAVDASISQIKKLLEDRAIKVDTLNLVERGFVPEDCSLLFSIGPMSDLYPIEVEAIKRYLDQGGKGFFMLDPTTSLFTSFDNFRRLLLDYGIEIKNDIVVDTNPFSQTLYGDYLTPLVSPSGSHPIIEGIPSSISFPVPQVRTVTASPDKPAEIIINELLKTSAYSWSESMEKILRNPQIKMPDEDEIKPQTIAVAASKPSPGAKEEEEMRLVVVGDSDMVLNPNLNQATAALFINAINWLTVRRDLIAIPPKMVEETPVYLSKAQVRLLFLLLVVSLPSIIFFGGLGYTVIRRRTR